MINGSRRLGELLVERKVLSRDDVEAALAEEQASGRSLPAVLVARGLVGERDLVAAIAEQSGQRFVDLDEVFLLAELDQLVPAELARTHLAVAVATEEGSIVVAMLDPSDRAAVAAIADATGCSVTPALAARFALQRVVEAMYGAGSGPVESKPTQPVQATSEMHLDELLIRTVAMGGSDLHLTVGVPPAARVNGSIVRMGDLPVMNGSEIRRMIFSVLTQRQRERFETELELDMSHPVHGVGRFRVNVFLQRDSIGVVARAIPNQLKPLAELGLPASVGQFAELPRGLVLVTGPTGSGKSTTLASLVDVINSSKQVHIMTVEDPIEFLHRHKLATVNQREVGEDTRSFATALKHVLRQDPDVILVGEMRDLETIHTALTAAETGHLVFATLHTQDAPQSVDRIIDVFPSHQQQQVRVQLASSLQGVVTQQLIPTVDGGRVCVAEVLVATPAIRNLIREGKTHQMYSAMQAGGSYGMTTMDQSLADQVRRGNVAMKVALERCANAEDLRRLAGGN